MVHRLVISCCLLTVLSTIGSSWASPLQISNGNNRTVDEPVEELESLKQKLPENRKSFEVSLNASHSFSDVNGRRQGSTNTQAQVNKNGEKVARVAEKTELEQEPEEPARGLTRTEFEIPSQGVYRTDREEDADSALEKMNALAAMKYTPLDMAEYVFWTGDEKGVTFAIEDLLKAGFMTRDDAITFLQSIKTYLDSIQSHYKGLRKMEDKIANKLHQQMGLEEFNEYKKKMRAKYLSELSEKQDKLGDEDLKEQRKRDGSEDYEEITERLKGADQLYNDYSLEEIVYQLAKLMFSQSLSQGSSQAHQALRRFTEYLEKEVAYGQISRQLEKKILTVLVAALSDTLGERPELIPAASEGLSNIGVQEPKSHIMERRKSRSVKIRSH